MACDIILLKISFENSINLGGENTHLDSKLKDTTSGLIGQFEAGFESHVVSPGSDSAEGSKP